MKYSLLLVLMLACCPFAFPQAVKPAPFASPFAFPLLLSGNFGEIRSNHFHGGLDFKTGGATGKPVLALAEGYITRIRVTHGSGYVLEVRYTNGYTTINRHLSAFTSPIAERIEELQYEQQRYEVELVPRPDEYPVKAGMPIALSGNTGYSFGPHLHLDVFETATGDYIDPLPLFGECINDRTAPRAHSIRLFPQPGEGVVQGSSDVLTIAAGASRVVEAWGVVGVAIKAFDYMEGASNHYGVHTVLLTVDGQEIFRSTVDRFASRENPMINSWTEAGYMKSFIDPGNTLRLLKASNGNRGLLTIDSERDYRLQYTLSDAFGNTSRYAFTLRGKRQSVEPLTHRSKYYFAWDKTNYLQEPGMTLTVPRGLLYRDVALDYSVRPDSGAIAFTYRLHDTPLALAAPCRLSIGLRRKPVADSTKYYIACITPRGGAYSVGGTYSDGFVTASIRQLATYTVALDTIAPLLTPIAPAAWGRNGQIVYRAKDAQTGIRSYRATIDGRYALFGIPNAIDPRMVCKLDPKRIARGKTHTVVMTVTDNCGNQTVRSNTFFW